MRKILLVIFLILFLPVFMEAIEIPNPIEAKSIQELVDALLNFIFAVALALAPLLIIVGGFFMVTSAGDTTKFETGKKVILYTLIGLVIILLAKGLISFLLERMEVPERGGSTDPRDIKGNSHPN